MKCDDFHFLVVQWLGFCASTVGGTGLISAWIALRVKVWPKNFKKKKKNFLRCKTKPVKIWVRAESLLCGRWREDREAGWGLFHLSVQTPPELSPFSFPFCDLQLIHGVEFAFLKYRASFLLCPLQMRWGAHKDLRFWYNLRLSDEFIPYKTAYILMTCVKTDISLSKWAEKSP